MRDAELTTEAAGLAERILDEISKLHHDWQEILIWAHELAELAEIGSVSLEPGESRPQQPRAIGSKTTRHRDFATYGAQERQRLAASLAALGHPTRLLILQALGRGRVLSAVQIAQLEPGASLSLIAYHVGELRSRGLLTPAGTRQARGAVQQFYTLSPRGRELLAVVEHLRG
jgi:DNA-binding transcriptional ArsR family regulator